MSREENGNPAYKGSADIKTYVENGLKHCLDGIRFGSEIWIVDNPIRFENMHRAIRYGRIVGKEDAVVRLLRRYQGRAEIYRVEKMRSGFDLDVNMIKKHLDHYGLEEE